MGKLNAQPRNLEARRDHAPTMPKRTWVGKDISLSLFILLKNAKSNLMEAGKNK